jgi:hypothetical protein
VKKFVLKVMKVKKKAIERNGSSERSALNYVASLMKPKTFRPPPSSLLAKVDKFLPKIQKANEALEQIPTYAKDIEQVEEGDQFIEMVRYCSPEFGFGCI